ncbi:MAG: sigma-70 family RNA polymerase sigma factor [Clostridiales bacterium]|nr:sigma-70 family RNA polymerase sigma factor [Clostridiales bacterium]
MYKNLSDEEILDKYKQGDEYALDFLLYKYKSLASKIARSYFLIGAESEDMLQEAMLGLYTACRTFVKGMSAFKSFATLCITRAVQSAVKSANRQKNKPLNDYLTLNNQGAVIFDANEDQDEDLVIYIPSNTLDPEKALLKEEEKQEINNMINENLSNKEKKVFQLYLQGLSYSEIAEKLGETTKSVDNAISRTKKKLEEVLK